MILTAAALGAVLWSTPASAMSKFVSNLHKAQSRKEPNERVEWYTRAIDSWEPAEGDSLLGACYFGRGQALVESWRFSDAEPDLTKAIAKDPINAKAYLLRGRVRLRLSRVSEAAQDLLEFLGREPSDVLGLVLLSEAHRRSGRGDAALKACVLAQQAEPADYRGWLCEGRAQMARKDWDAAERALTVADDRGGDQKPDVLVERAVCRVAQGRHEQALTDYSRAIPLFDAELKRLPHDQAPEPQVDETRQDLARAYFSRGRVREFLVQREEAFNDYVAACRLGHEQACARAEALEPQAQEKIRRKKPEPVQAEPVPEPPKKKKRIKLPSPDSDPGDRIYGS